jgi:hypothetical protein
MLALLPENRITLNQVVELGFAPSIMKLVFEQFETQNQQKSLLIQRIRTPEEQNQLIPTLTQGIQALESQDQILQSLTEKIEILEFQNQNLQTLTEKIEILEAQNKEMTTLSRKIEILARQAQSTSQIPQFFATQNPLTRRPVQSIYKRNIRNYP